MLQPIRKRIRVAGIVQGVGFRPHIWQLAQDLRLAGWVHNDSAGVTIEIQGHEPDVVRFLDSIQSQLPPLARLDSLTILDISLTNDLQFLILESVGDSKSSTPVSPDIAVCDDCLKEMDSPGNRRYGYPFINCTNCGPRFTILEYMPYDRGLTTMKSFPMCQACLQEYQNPLDRRFHAQPNACHGCGPRVWFVADPYQDRDFLSFRNRHLPEGDAAIEAFQNAVNSGAIVAVKGIGGFHLVCDATDNVALAKLRERKGRIDKPFAVMVPNIESCRLFACVSKEEQLLLESQARPIVLLRKIRQFSESRCVIDKENRLNTVKVSRKHDNETTPGLSELVAPHNNFIGVMLPYSPLHHLLLRNSRPLVMTSGNISGEPIVRENIEAKNRLSRQADCFLLHDREIYVVCDDSVVRCLGKDLLPLRRSRGYAPMPIKLREPGPSVLAVGGELKATFCATTSHYAYMSQHLGDMENLETLEAMQRSVEHFLRLFRIQPQAIVADLHPAYLSTKWANDFARSLNVPFLQVQHHHANIAALLAEHAWPSNRPMIGCCFDGTGFGTDHAIWGGEFLIADAKHFQRFAHLKYFPLPGGDESIRRPYRVALAQLFSAGIPWDERLPSVQAATASELRILRQQLEKNLHCVATSSMGRLFDAVASLIGIRQQVNYEAQAAMEMEALAATQPRESSSGSTGYRFRIDMENPMVIDPGPVISSIADDVFSGIEAAVIAARFHHAVAQLVVDVCFAARQAESINAVGLSGGVFQNILLLELTREKLMRQGFEVYLHRQVPPNDGGIALGQALIAQRLL